MSGICGIVALDGAAPSGSDLEAMVARLEQRGPDGSHSWLSGQTGLGHTLLATTPESLVEELPFTDPMSGCTITADVRLDNREELIAALDLDGESRVIGDGELILRAYLLCGENCPKQLLGDFAFAIWDPRSQRLFCARDHIGMRQLIYCHLPGRLFVFASETESVLAHPEAPNRINDERIADFLDNLEGVDLTSTFFEEVFRLPPAHCLSIDREGLAIYRYWELRPSPELRLGSDEEYADAFLNQFTEALRCRLRSAGPVGAMLSGGIDSSSVAAVASQVLADEGSGPLHSFSAIRSDARHCPETQTIQLALNLPGLGPHLIADSDLKGMRDDLVRLTNGIAEPFDGHMTMIRTVYLAAHRAGLKTMLDGVAGDTVLSSSNRVAGLLRQVRPRQAWHEAKGLERFWKVRGLAVRTWLSAAWVAFIPEPLRAPVRKIRWGWNDRSSARRRAIAGRFSREVKLARRRSLHRSHLAAGRLSEVELRAAAMRHPHLPLARERYDRVASELAIEPRDPFCDIRLIQFCLSLPEEQFQRRGWPKYVLRRAMAGLLPEEVIWRRGKEHLGWHFTETLFRSWPGWRDWLRASVPILGRYVSRGLLREAASDRPDASDTEQLMELYFLANWLKRNGPAAS